MVERDVIQLLFLDEKLSQEDMAKAAHTTRYRVRKVIDAMKLVENLTLEDVLFMSDEKLLLVLYPQEASGQPLGEFDAERWYMRVNSGKRITRMYVWSEEYGPECVGQGRKPFSYPQFCRLLRAYSKENHPEITMPINREPGKEMFIDWVGDKLPYIDPVTMDMAKASVFVTTLGDSSYLYVEAFEKMTQVFWNQGHINALNYYGGCPRIFTPDNTKTAVEDRRLYDTRLNESYRELAIHYGVAIIPARSWKPRDKGSVESAVSFVETQLFPWLESRGPYVGIDALNAAIRERVAELCDNDFQERPGTRRSVFEAVDKPALRPLPEYSPEVFESDEQTVRKDYTVKCGDFFYTVPHKYVNKKVSIHLYSNRVEFFHGNEPIAKHDRRFSGPLKVINPDHMPENHRSRLEYLNHDGDYYRQEAAMLGGGVSEVVRLLLLEGPVEEEGYRSCSGILSLGKKYGAEALDAACRKALSIQSVNYTTVKNLLTSGANKPAARHAQAGKDEARAPEHKNIRTDWG